MGTPTLATTRPVAVVRTIADIVAIESRPYDERVTARNLHDLLRATAAHVGERQALTVLRSEDPHDVGGRWTHRELLWEVTRAANLFRALGLAPGRGVAAFLAPTLPEVPPLLLGAQIAGVASSLNYLLSADAIADLLNAVQATVLVVPARAVDANCWDKANAVRDRVPTLRHVLVAGTGAANGPDGPGGTDLADALAAHDGARLDFAPTTERDTVCALFHTGGTTGRPKLVRLTHGNQIHAAFGFAQVFGYDENDVVIDGLPFFHVGGTMTVGLAALAAGGHVVVPSPYALRPPAVIARYWQIARHFGATVVGGVPTSIAALTNAWRPGDDASTVRMAMTGGAVLPRAVGERFEATTGIRIFETYGMTETAAAIAFNPGRGEPRAGSVGFRAPYASIRIVRLEAGRPVPCGPRESGLVQVRGPQVFPGYLDASHDQGVLDDEGWLTTGDVGYLTDDERLVLTGREKDLIIRGGHNIDPAAIEDVANQFDGVQISAAVGMPDAHAGEVPVLFVVPAPGVSLDLEALERHLQAQVHEAPARPRSVWVLDALPVTAVGKIFKPALRDLAIREKVNQEALRVCGPGATVAVEVQLDARKHTVAQVTVGGAADAALQALADALAPLPQTYVVRSADAAADAVTGDEPVLLQVDGGIATLTLNRPRQLNALSHELMACLAARLDTLAALPGLRAVVLTGAGRAFSAGGDLLEFDTALRAGGERLIALLRYNQNVIQRLEDLPVPVIGAVNGLAVAGGLELLLCCDLLIAAAGAQLGDGHARYGIVPAGGASVRLPERIAPAHAARLFYTAAMVDSDTAAGWGLVDEVVPADGLMPWALALAREIASRSPEAVRHIKALTSPRRHGDARAQRIAAEIEHFAAHLAGADLARGLAAFRARQEPHF